MFGAKTGQKIVLIQYKKDFVPLILSDLVHRASHITLVVSSSYSQREAERRKEEDSVEFCD